VERLEGLDAPVAQIGEAQSASGQVWRGGAPIRGTAVLELEASEAARPEFQPDLQLEGRTGVCRGTAATTLPHPGQGIGQDDRRAILEIDRRKARQQGNGHGLTAAITRLIAAVSTCSRQAAAAAVNR